MPRRVTPFVLLSILAGVAGSAAQPGFAQPVLHGATIHSLGAPAPDLERAAGALFERVDGVAWATWTVPMTPGHRTLCCGRGHSGCSLEDHSDFHLHRDDPVAAGSLHVMLRIRNHRFTQIRAFSDGCDLDAGGLDVYVWEGVDARQSLDFLTAAAEDGGKDLGENALVAIAYHAGGEADRVLERVARGEQMPRLEEEAIFWLGEARGTGGFEALERLRRDLSDVDRLEQIAFALHLSEAPGAVGALIEMARDDPRRDVREQALFWLSQQAGERAADAIAEAAEEDPDLEVKEQAVFALSQLPPDRGVPLLIRYAETHPSREIRKKAVFWLGQTEDPRALDFFAEILAR